MNEGERAPYFRCDGKGPIGLGGRAHEGFVDCAPGSLGGAYRDPAFTVRRVEVGGKALADGFGEPRTWDYWATSPPSTAIA